MSALLNYNTANTISNNDINFYDLYTSILLTFLISLEEYKTIKAISKFGYTILL